MLNFVVEPAVLEPFVPAGTELDTWQGLTFLSLVGFLFANTRVRGIPIPWHRNFEEVNLRFYVRRQVAGEVRRAVTFIRELVPSHAVALTARLAYNEPYRALPMRHTFGSIRSDGVPTRVTYEWRIAHEWTTLDVAVVGEGRVAAPGSQEAFITEHYWGYTRQRDRSTVEYEVVHPPWRVWDAQASPLVQDMSGVYGSTFARILQGTPASAFLANGSSVTVYPPRRVEGKPASH